MFNSFRTSFWALNFVQRYVQFLAARSPIGYVIVVVPQMFMFSLGLLLLISSIIKTPTKIPDWNSPIYIWLALSLAPAIETFICQLISFEVLGAFRANKKICFASSWLIFFTLHLSNGLAAAFTAGIVGGFFLALTYGLWRRISIAYAYTMTFVCHALLNAMVLTTMYLLGG